MAWYIQVFVPLRQVKFGITKATFTEIKRIPAQPRLQRQTSLIKMKREYIQIHIQRTQISVHSTPTCPKFHLDKPAIGQYSPLQLMFYRQVIRGTNFFVL